ncbi:hypothetical protein M427DRAFT_191363 [Gonapodya prolifera JEL478]|uniref:Phospholipid/glycerol acyltransferase domain-containing protein n=1 Tax=Gonapodya prolifera (strain JEL478) TaxID=1344416 RepID=A0A138ZZZ8_GONPJ|nr:hypothetical protein M427DRAFT_191363 [Gonapodya prolifera JEL478]|eukprot:KXS10079.1 hypothetical protein M427DRAFT_191363 [Gonapodya prolifera JEL478]
MGVLGFFRILILGGGVTLVMVVFNILQVLSLPLQLTTAGRVWVTKWSSFAAGVIWYLISSTFEKIHGMPITYSGDELPDGESAIFLPNHQGFSDFNLVNFVALRHKMLPNCKYFIKDSIKWMPFFGWGMYMMGMIFLKRNWDKDQGHVKSTFQFIKNNRIPVWLVSYLEGTRITPQKKEESQAFAKQRGLPVLENVLIPRTKGFIATVQELRGSHVTAVYDAVFAYRYKKTTLTKIPSLTRIYSGPLAPDYEVHVHVRRFPISSLPNDEAGLNKWVMERWMEKDKVLHRLNKSWTDGMEGLKNGGEWNQVWDHSQWANAVDSHRKAD